MAHALVRSAGSMHRLAQASVASSVLVSDWVQPVGITSLLAWHRQSTIDHRKLFSSEDKQSTPHATAQDQAEASKQSGPGKPQQAAAGATTGVAQKLIMQDPPNFWSLLTEPFRSMTGSLAVWAVKNRVETTFDEQEFLEGAKDAWYAVNTCMNDKDLEKLAEMCTPALMNTFREVFADPETKNKIFEMVDLQVQHAQVAGAQFLLPDAPPVAAGSESGAAVAAPQVSDGPPSTAHWSQWAMNSAKGALGGSTLAMWVRFSGTLSKQLVKDTDGKLLTELEDRRSSWWLFVRGPLPDKLPVRELDVPWQLMVLQ